MFLENKSTLAFSSAKKQDQVNRRTISFFFFFCFRSYNSLKSVDNFPSLCILPDSLPIDNILFTKQSNVRNVDLFIGGKSLR